MDTIDLQSSPVVGTDAQPERRKDISKVTIDAQLEGIVTNFLDGKEIREGELQLAQEVKLQRVATERRGRVIEVRDKLHTLEGRWRSELDRFRVNAGEMTIKSTQVDTYGAAACGVFAEQAEFNKDREESTRQIFQEQHEIAISEMWHDAEGGERAEVDPFTGLHTKEALMDRMGSKITAWEMAKTPEEVSAAKNELLKIRIKSGDMNNFKQGNDILGHDGFDEFLQDELAVGFMAMSQYLGSKEYGGQPDPAVIDKFFPPESDKRARLDAAKGKFVVDFYRQKPGADEVLTATEFMEEPIDDKGSNYDEIQKQSDQLVNDVFHGCVLGRYENPKEAKVIREAFESSPQVFRFEPVESAGGTKGMIEPEAMYWNGFGDKLSFYLNTNGLAAPIETNTPPAYLRMSADMSSARDLSEAIKLFTSGKDFQGNRINGKIARGGVGMVNDDRTVDKNKSEEFDHSVKTSAKNRVSAVGITNASQVDAIIKRAGADKISGLALKVLNDESDHVKKPEGKRDVLYRSWTAEPGTQEGAELAYQVGSLRMSDRLKKEMSDPEKREEVYQKTLDHYITKFSDELGKLDAALKAINWDRSKGVGALMPIFIGGPIDGPQVDKNLITFYYSMRRMEKSAQDDYLSYRLSFDDDQRDAMPIEAPYLPKLPELPESIKMSDLQNYLLS